MLFLVIRSALKEKYLAFLQHFYTHYLRYYKSTFKKKATFAHTKHTFILIQE